MIEDHKGQKTSTKNRTTGEDGPHAEVNSVLSLGNLGFSNVEFFHDTAPKPKLPPAKFGKMLEKRLTDERKRQSGELPPLPPDPRLKIKGSVDLKSMEALVEQLEVSLQGFSEGVRDLGTLGPVGVRDKLADRIRSNFELERINEGSDIDWNGLPSVSDFDPKRMQWLLSSESLDDDEFGTELLDATLMIAATMGSEQGRREMITERMPLFEQFRKGVDEMFAGLAEQPTVVEVPGDYLNERHDLKSRTSDAAWPKDNHPVGDEEDLVTPILVAFSKGYQVTPKGDATVDELREAFIEQIENAKLQGQAQLLGEPLREFHRLMDRELGDLREYLDGEVTNDELWQRSLSRMAEEIARFSYYTLWQGSEKNGADIS